MQSIRSHGTWAAEVTRTQRIQVTVGAPMALERATLPVSLRPPRPGMVGWRYRLVLHRESKDGQTFEGIGEAPRTVVATLVPSKNENYLGNYTLSPEETVSLALYSTYGALLFNVVRYTHLGVHFPSNLREPNVEYPETVFRPLAGKRPKQNHLADGGVEIKQEELEGGSTLEAVKLVGYNREN
ncbi:hypothetical protein D9611_009740 [Ephemerocybe angulata]|uniref:Uncharacterized protein n=1 Tax=Ephemerocybe angulata TaxID=980116 RepID=A0A8H5FGH7_9AGAR|nr:hypothetical protein D9611_009740 [Tulosesus angulatus]